MAFYEKNKRVGISWNWSGISTGIYVCACKHIDIGAIGSGTGGFDRKFIRRDADQYRPGDSSNRGFPVPAFDNEY